MEISAQVGNTGFSMKDLLAKSSFNLPKPGDIVGGEIISISKNSVLIDLGSLGTGIVYPGEFYDNTTLQKSLKAGQQISGVLLDIENEDGYRELSLKRAQMTTAWEDIRKKKETGEVITTKIININKGGLIVEINSVQGFLPLSQLAPEHYPKIEGGDTTKIVQALQKFRNQDIQIKIIDFSAEENRLIVSEKAINDAQLKEEVMKFNVGEIVDAEVTDVTDFGAFVNIPVPGSESISEDGTEKIKSKVEGLIHISEIDWKIIDNPRNVLKSGQTVKAKIISIDGNKISLSLKALKSNPWEKIEEKYQVGQIVSGEVLKMTSYGALVKLDEEISGFLPTSELTDKKVEEAPKLGDKITAAIVSIDSKERRILLTLEKNA